MDNQNKATDFEPVVAGKYTSNIPPFQVESGFGPITDRILNNFYNFLTNKEFQDKVSNKLVNPLTQIINDKMKPYMYISIVLYGIIIVLLITIIYMLKK